MISLNYDSFVKIISEFNKFTIDDLNELYKKYGKKRVDDYFEQYVQTLEEQDQIKFFNKFLIYFENLYRSEDTMLNVDTTDTIGMMISNDKIDLLTVEEEREYGRILKLGKEKLVIIKENNQMLDNDGEIEQDKILYSDIDIFRILISIKDDDSLNKLKELKHLPFALNDKRIFYKELPIINKYLKLCSNGIISEEELRNNFSDVDFNSIEKLSKEELLFQMDLLKKVNVAKYYLFNCNMGLVMFFAKRIYDGKYPYEDRIQDGYIGLIKAINRFDVDQGYKFSTYATWWIRQAIIRTMQENSDIIRKPIYMVEKINKLKKFINHYDSINGCNPTMSECADEFGVSEKVIGELMMLDTDALSLDVHYTDDEDNNACLLGVLSTKDVPVEDLVASRDYYDSVIQLINDSFSKRNAYILINRLGLNAENRVHTLEEIGTLYNVSRERIRQLEAKLLPRLRKRIKLMEITNVKRK